ncbi:spore germination protein [Desulforamulus aeronauticus]|uniref:Spore germination protein KA n=1 Tax=Desulforamulus aeronauticus DSM 10349 TaxID=1121421 RepID=A0A1M6VT18_9FIRM|nr:spore germination protein [Desulforamulus aeronauticus]SHK84465.1 spore germination protein KA [Desulforamulus aeronauticus DSM 10349]
MFGINRPKKSRKIKEEVALLNHQVARDEVSGRYDETVGYLKELFRDDDVMQFRELQNKNAGDLRFCLVYCDGLVDSELIGAQLIRPLLELQLDVREKITADALLEQIIQTVSGKKLCSYREIVRAVTGGDTLLITNVLKEGLLFSVKKFETRSVSEPEGEKILSGPREGFTEELLSNLSMIRRKLRTNRLKMRFYTIGKETQTQLGIAYLDEIVNENILKELYRRLDTIDIDGVLDTNYITELVRDNPWSPFRSIGYTERPDVVAGKLLEGRIALFVDGTPVVLTLPYLFIENFQSNEDYYLNFYYTSFSRFLRILGFFLTVLVPAVYIAIAAYHQEMLPAPILIRIAIERQRVPLPAALECFLMLLVFDILRETGLRMPTNVGQTLGIVGALVVGQAAVEAGLVAAPMIIVVAMAGITSLLIPKMNAPVIYIRFGILALGASLGFLGVTLGCALLLAHVLSLHSFGVSQLASGHKLQYQEIKDTVIRAPWWQMRLRPFQLSPNRVREKSGKREQS